MNFLTWKNADLIRIVESGIKHWPNGAADLYGEKTGNGFWLVGDDGVYLMQNGNGEVQPRAIAYAVECNPATDPDGWWDVKALTWGGDDGAMFIEAATIIEVATSGADMRVEFKGDTIEFVALKKKPKPPKIPASLAHVPVATRETIQAMLAQARATDKDKPN